MIIYELHNNPYDLDGYEDRHMIVPSLAYNQVCKNGSPIPECEHAIAREPYYAYNYALFMLKRRWKEGESAILTSPVYSRLYATNVIRGRWLDGESIIATDAYHAYWYAKDVVQGRFRQGESTMANDRVVGHWYVIEVLHPIYPGRTERYLIHMMKNGGMD